MRYPDARALAQSGPNRVSTRFDHSSKFLTTNFTVGDANGRLGQSLYNRDYSCAETYKQGDKPTAHGAARGENIGGKNIGQEQSNVKNPTKPKFHSNNFTLGDDVLTFKTVYNDDYIYDDAHKASWRRNVAPLQHAQVLPPSSGRFPQRGCIDFGHFGSTISRDIYSSRRDDLSSIKDMHTQDSVALTQNGKRRRMLTRAMVDYQHPLERIHGNIKLLMVRAISPGVRQDSIWQSVNNGGSSQIRSEAHQAYRWPLASTGLPRKPYKSAHTTST